MAPDEHIRRPPAGSSDVLGEIYEIVERRDPEQPKQVGPQFRAEALRQLDVPSTLDNLLLLTSRRIWLAIAGIAIALVAGILYAGNTVRVQGIAASGRAVAPPGIINAASPTTGVITSVLVAEGDLMSAGQVVAGGKAANGTDLVIVSPLPGTAWQQLAAAGAVVDTGTVVTQLLPPESGTKLLVQVPEATAGPVEIGQRVDLSYGSGMSATGSVTEIDRAPVPAAVADAALAMSTEESPEPVVLVTVTANTQLPPGTAVTATIIQSERTLLAALWGL